MYLNRGQAMVEFVVGVMVVVLFLVLIPLLGKLLQIRMKVVEAANYVVWEQAKGVAEDDAGMGMTVGHRFFSAQGIGVNSEWKQHANHQGWLTNKGKIMVDGTAVKVLTNTISDKSFKSVRQLTSALSLSTTNLVSPAVVVKVNNLEEYAWLPDSLTMTQQFSIVRDSWTSSSPQDVQLRIGRATVLHPYPKLQRPIISTVNNLLSLIFGEIQVKTNLVNPEVVPKDRLVKYED
ncbi:MAG: hypothetical protein Q7T36_12700 [Fluviicoccus sp.]|uniref:hypothetical protein n=1 Tax=Fluviicoccus sp. TaxID=2003552 RepID=UPI00271D37D1|nr:hypothetical protein [Fluviicoccus sp.]MDO8331320.1 hypothetical protein [Fluviicoccus sp.]